MQLALLNAFNNEAICQVAEVLFLTVGVILGWLVWPVVHQKLAQSASQRKEAALLEESESSNIDLEDEEQDYFRDEHLKVAQLFDHYELFGASPGVWSGTRSDGADLEDDGLEDSAEVELEDEKQDMSHDERLKVADLFEHYELFGASPGVWSSTESDGSDFEDDCLDESAEELIHEGNLVEPMISKVAHLELFEHYGLFGAPVGTWSS